MTPEQHYAEAERQLQIAQYLLEKPDDDNPELYRLGGRGSAYDRAIATAHVHAVLSQSPRPVRVT